MAEQHHYKSDAVALHVAQRHLAMGLSFHIVAHRFAALATRQALAAAELLASAGEALPAGAVLAGVGGDSASAAAVFEQAVAALLGSADSAKARESRALLLLDEPLQLYTAVTDTRAGLWRRNGNVISVQLLNWAGQFRSTLKYVDMLACQIAMVSNSLASFSVYFFSFFIQ